MTESATLTRPIVEAWSPASRAGSPDTDRTSAENPRRRAHALVFGTWLPALRGAVTVREGRWLW
jgi:hypothetical protein